MRTALLIAAKDLRQRLRDRSALLVALVAPARAGVDLRAHPPRRRRAARTTFHYAVVDLDRGAASRRRSPTHVLAPLEREGLVAVHREPASVAGARRAGRSRARSPRRSSSRAASRRRSRRGGPARIAVARQRRQPDRLAGGGVDRALVRAPDRRRAHRDRGRAAARARGALAAAAEPPASRSRTSRRRRKELDATTFYAAGMAVFFLFFTVQLGVSSLLDERRDGTLARMLVAPDPPRRRSSWASS